MNMLDLRLLPIAGGLWCGAAIGLHARPNAWLLLALTVMSAGLVVVRRKALAPFVAACIIALPLAAMRADAAAPAAIAQVIARSGAIEFVAVIDSEPQVRDRAGFGGAEVERILIARATLITVRTEDGKWATSMPVTLQWSPDGVRHRVGEQVSGRSVPRPHDIASRSAYWLRVQGALNTRARESRGAWLASRMRDGLARATDARNGGDGAALLPGLVLGDTRAQSPQLVDALRLAGLSHLTAVSGANLAIVLGAVLWLLARTRVRRRSRFVILFSTIAVFVVIVQPQPSVVRAAMMGGISVFALATGAQRASISTLWLAVAALLVLDPFLAWQWGFALSVAATAGLIMLGPWFLARIGNKPLGVALAVTVSAQLATFPVLLAMGRPPTWLSIPANMLCGPLVAPATVLGFASTLVSALGLIPGLSALASAAASVVAWPGVRIADAIAWIAHQGVATPLAVAPVQSLGALAAAVIVSVLAYRVGMRARSLCSLLLIAVIVTTCRPDGLHRWPQRDWWYAMCDVGQGDSSVINLGDGSVLLFDAGPDPAPERECLRLLGVREIRALFITHFHADHVEGLSAVSALAPIRQAFSTSVREPQVEWQRVLALLHVEPTPLAAGDVLQFGATRVEVLWPVPSETTGEPNNASLILDVSRGDAHVLITGDADPDVQAAVGLPVTGYVALKVPHHGSRFHDPTFIGRVSPTLALISVGAGNDYGHPAADVVAAYGAAGARVLRTDLVGSIAVTVHGGQISYATLSG